MFPKHLAILLNLPSSLPGNDVIISQTLLSRTSVLRINVTGTFDEASFVAVKTFQKVSIINDLRTFSSLCTFHSFIYPSFLIFNLKINKIFPSGVLDGPTASLLLELNSFDGWQVLPPLAASPPHLALGP